MSRPGLVDRLAAFLRSAAKVRGAQWVRVHRQTGRELELVQSAPVEDEELRDNLACIAIVEQIQVAIRDDLGMLPSLGDPVAYVVVVGNEDGKELARDRISMPRNPPPTTTTAIVAAAGAELAPTNAHPPGSAAWELHETRGPSVHVMQSATLRQQYRHNEALVGHMVRGYADTTEGLHKIIKTLSDQNAALLTARMDDAQKMIEVLRASRIMEAEAKAEELRAESFRVAAGTLAEWLPVALNKIARKWGLSGDDAVDPMLEKMILSISSEQTEKLGQILTPVQRDMLGDLWIAVHDRKMAREKKAASEKAQREKDSKDVKASVGIPTNGKNEAAP